MITFMKRLASAVPTPAAGKVTYFVDSTAGFPSFKDDAGVVTTVESTGNKVTAFSSPTNTQYPSALLVSTQLGFKINTSQASAVGLSMLGAADAAAQTALLNNFSATLKGLVPLSGGGTANFLRADGTWAAAGGGATLGANTFTDTQTFTLATVNKSLFVSTGYSVTGANTTPAFSFNGTWNTTGAPTLLDFNIVGTAYALPSKFLRFAIDSVQLFHIDTYGRVYADNSFNLGPSGGNGRFNASHLVLNSTQPIGWNFASGAGNAPDSAFSCIATNVVGLGNGTAGDTTGTLKLRYVTNVPVAVASLMSAVTAGNGTKAHVTDASAPTFGATVAGGGAVSTPVYSDGAAWKVG